MKLTITKLLLFGSLILSQSSCGAFSDSTEVEVQMYGIASAPSTATGDQDPQFQTYEIQSIVLSSPDGDVSILDQAESFKIVDRPQIVTSFDAADLAGRSFTGYTVTFGSTVTGGDKDQPNLSFTLTTVTQSLTQTLEIKEGSTLNLAIKLNWGNTLASGAMSEPAFVLTAK